jgi:Flp pilus assembly protein TadG
MNLFRRLSTSHRQRGQVIPLVALLIVVLLLFVGLGIDMGFAYVTKASLSKAADAAALTGIRNYPLGETQATALALSAFTANYGAPSRSTTPVVTTAWSTDANNNTLFTVNATSTISTFFIRVLPQWATMNVSASAQTTRAHVVMSLVLDRSGSMNHNGGAQALPPAVEEFVNFFDNNLDQVAQSSFSTNATLDVAMEHNFQAPIDAAVESMTFGGGTWAQGGLEYAQIEETSVTIPPGQNTVKVVVFFTDGRANMNQDTLSCSPAALSNYGGCSPFERAAPFNCTDVSWWPSTGQYGPPAGSPLITDPPCAAPDGNNGSAPVYPSSNGGQK